MKTILASALALGLMTSAALAAPVKLTDARMDQVRAGQGNIAVGCVLSAGVGAILGIGASTCTGTAAGGTAVAVACMDGRCRTVESTGPVAAVVCVNGRCDLLR
jgi:hypothetical protein